MNVKELKLVDIYLLSYLIFDFDFFQGLLCFLYLFKNTECFLRILGVVIEQPLCP